MNKTEINPLGYMTKHTLLKTQTLLFQQCIYVRIYYLNTYKNLIGPSVSITSES